MTKFDCVTGINWINPNYISSKSPSWNIKVRVVVRILSEMVLILTWNHFIFVQFFISVVIEIVAAMTDDLSHAAPPLSFQTLLSFFSATACLLSSTVCGNSLYLPSTSQPPHRGSASQHIRRNAFMLQSTEWRPTALENKEKRFKTYVRFKTATSALCFMVTAVP